MKTATGKSACATRIPLPTLELMQKIALDNILYICRL
jgi:hypothetical protein